MSEPIYIDMSLADAFKSAGLDINNPEDIKIFQEAALAMRTAGHTVSEVAKIAKDNRNRDGVSILEELNSTDHLGETPSPDPNQPKDPDQAKRDGYSILDAWNQSHPL